MSFQRAVAWAATAAIVVPAGISASRFIWALARLTYDRPTRRLTVAPGAKRHHRADVGPDGGGRLARLQRRVLEGGHVREQAVENSTTK